MGRQKIRHNKKGSLVSGLSLPKAPSKGVEDVFHISFKHLDKNQGQSFHNWQKEGILADALDTLYNYSHNSISSQIGKKFTCYGDFPPKEKTEFYHPPHVPDDAEWARIHVNNLQIIAGHIFKNTFYVVFLDKDHKFYISEKKNT